VFVRLPPVVGDWELYWYDVPTRTETKFSTISRDIGLGRFSMSGNRVVWHTRRNDNWDVFLYDFVTRTETRITTHPAEQATPSIHGDLIAWEDRRNGGTRWDIYTYDLTTETERRITAAPTSGRAPVVSADRIVWGDTRGPFPTYLGFSLYEYDLTRVPQERRIPTTPMENDLASFGPYIAWVNRNDQNPVFYDDVFLYNFASATELRLTRLPAKQWRPAVSAEYVVWEDHRNGNPDIYVARLADLFR
jgi:beta propeller repeat protein